MLRGLDGPSTRTPPAGLKYRRGVDLVRQLVNASRAGQTLRCGSAAIDARDLRRACRVATAGRADPFGFRLSDARVIGQLDLRATTVPVPLSFVSCHFTDPLLIEGANLHELVITDGRQEGDLDGPPESASYLPGLLGDGVTIAHDLILSGSVIEADLHTRASRSRTAAVWLIDADIGGRLLAAGTRIAAAGGQAMSCSRARIRGEVRLVHGFVAVGAVRMLAARLDGYLDLSGASLASAEGAALDLNEATVGGSVFVLDAVPSGIRATIQGRLELGRATIHGQLLIRGADLHPSPPDPDPHTSLSENSYGRPAVLASHLVVHGRCAVQGATEIDGAVALRGADLRSGLEFNGVTIRNAGGVALDLSNAVLNAGLHLSDATMLGTINLLNARVAGVVDLSGSKLSEPLDQRSLRGAGLLAERDINIRSLVAHGSVDFRGAVVLGMLDAEDAEIVSPGTETLGLHQAHVRGNVRVCGGFRSIGVLVLAWTRIDGRLRCDGATLTWEDRHLSVADWHNPGGMAVDATSATINGGINLGWRITAGGIDLSHVTTTYLADRPESDWPTETRLGGFRYERFVHATDAASRIAWLSRLRVHDPGTWEQAARVLRAGGDQTGADDLLIAQRRHARRTKAAPPGQLRRAFDLLQDVTVRYGFRPQRALGVLLLLIAAVTLTLSLPAARATMRTTDQDAVVFSPSGAVSAGASTGDCGGGKVRCFNAVFYAIDTVVPIIDLKQRATWYPSPDRGGAPVEWWLNTCTILGWIASTIFALSFTRLGREQQ